jgi:hypothetical protein
VSTAARSVAARLELGIEDEAVLDGLDVGDRPHVALGLGIPAAGLVHLAA